MPNLVHQLLARHEPKRTLLQQVKAVLGAVIGLGIVGTLAAVTSMPLLFAPLGPTALLVFAEPEMPTAQPVNVMAGYFIATSFATLAEIWLPGAWWGAVVAVGLAMTLMLLLRVTHPPAVSVPLVVLSSPLDPLRLLAVLLAGCTVLLLVAALHHRLPPRARYPWSPEDDS
jgi:CBS-domain-containing membrane protein